MIIFCNTLGEFFMFRTKHKKHFNMFRYKNTWIKNKSLFLITSILFIQIVFGKSFHTAYKSNCNVADIDIYSQQMQ